MFVAIDRTSKFAFVQLHEKETRRIAAEFLRDLIATIPYTIHTVLTDNGTQFTSPGNRRSAASDIKPALDSESLFRAHAFELACVRNDVDHRLTKPKHPWTNGQVERMNRTLKEATVKRYHYGTHDQLREHLQTFLMAITLLNDSKHYVNSRRMNTSVKFGLANRIALSTIHPSTLWD